MDKSPIHLRICLPHNGTTQCKRQAAMASAGYLASGVSHALDLRRVLSFLREKSQFQRFSSKSMIDGGETE
jgi:hypothetical protein